MPSVASPLTIATAEWTVQPAHWIHWRKAARRAERASTPLLSLVPMIASYCFCDIAGFVVVLFNYNC